MGGNLIRIFLGVVMGFAALLFLNSPAQAHKVNIFAYVENGMVHTESYFPDGRKIEAGAVEVFDKAGTKIVDGKTGQDGRFSFPLPATKDDLTIVLNASMGHKTTFLLKKSEM